MEIYKTFPLISTKNLKKNDFVISIVPANGLALPSARASAGMMMNMFVFHGYTGPASEKSRCEKKVNECLYVRMSLQPTACFILISPNFFSSGKSHQEDKSFPAVFFQYNMKLIEFLIEIIINILLV